MELKKRAFAKALTWQTMGFFMLTGLVYLATGSLTAASGLALGSFLIGTVTYVVHERVWSRIHWGLVKPAGYS